MPFLPATGSGGGGGVAAWGGITGTLHDQTDLQSALDGKATSEQGALAQTAVQPNPTSFQINSGATISKVLIGTALIGSNTNVQAGGQIGVNITVTGAAAGDFAFVASPGSGGNPICASPLVMGELMVTADTVTVFIYNTDPISDHQTLGAAVTLYAMVFKAS